MQNGKTNQLGLMHLEKVPSMKHIDYIQTKNSSEFNHFC